MNPEQVGHEEIDPLELQRLRSLFSDLSESDGELEAPPASLWADIESALAAESGAAESNVVELRPRRKAAIWAAAAAVAAVVGVGVSGILKSTPTEAVVASVDITNLDMPVQDDAFGTARLISVDGDLQLEIHVEDLETDSGYLELWLINPDVTDMYSLGEVNGDGRYDLPDNIDPAEFPIVDVSFEDRDGVATHSGKSVLRGVLDI